MTVNTLSVKPPYAQLICYGVKPVENRTWKTDYRGPMYIHASRGAGEYIGFPDLTDYPLPLFKELEGLYDKEKKEFSGEADHILFDDGELFLRKKFAENPAVYAEYMMMTDLFLRSNENRVCFHESAIIGKADLVEIQQDVDSPWSEPGCYHWIFKNAVMFDKPIRYVKGQLRIWKYELKEAS
jgi:hypothetical protein